MIYLYAVLCVTALPAAMPTPASVTMTPTSTPASKTITSKFSSSSDTFTTMSTITALTAPTHIMTTLTTLSTAVPTTLEPTQMSNTISANASAATQQSPVSQEFAINEEPEDRLGSSVNLEPQVLLESSFDSKKSPTHPESPTLSFAMTNTPVSQDYGLNVYEQTQSSASDYGKLRKDIHLCMHNSQNKITQQLKVSDSFYSTYSLSHMHNKKRDTISTHTSNLTDDDKFVQAKVIRQMRNTKSSSVQNQTRRKLKFDRVMKKKPGLVPNTVISLHQLLFSPLLITTSPKSQLLGISPFLATQQMPLRIPVPLSGISQPQESGLPRKYSIWISKRRLMKSQNPTMIPTLPTLQEAVPQHNPAHALSAASNVPVFHLVQNESSAEHVMPPAPVGNVARGDSSHMQLQNKSSNNTQNIAANSTDLSAQHNQSASTSSIVKVFHCAKYMCHNPTSSSSNTLNNNNHVLNSTVSAHNGSIMHINIKCNKHKLCHNTSIEGEADQKTKVLVNSSKRGLNQSIATINTGMNIRKLVQKPFLSKRTTRAVRMKNVQSNIRSDMQRDQDTNVHLRSMGTDSVKDASHVNGTNNGKQIISRQPGHTRRGRRRRGRGRKRAHRRHRGHRRNRDLSLWIDEKQVKIFSGYTMEIYCIHNGKVLPYILDPNFERHLPVIPSEVESFNFTWGAGRRKYRYTFDRLYSHDEHILHSPLISLPNQGRIPKRPQVFTIKIQCTGNASGTASFGIGLLIQTLQGKPLQGMPLRLTLRKECTQHGPDPECDEKCENGGVCDSGKRCRCPEGYMGQYCNTALCYPQCMNGGTCTTPGRCSCPPGYNGRHCEGGICQRKCENGGKCIQKDTCSCPRGYYGNHCEFSKCVIPCVNGGRCRDVNKCRCPLGFTGDHCEVVHGHPSEGINISSRCRKRCDHGSCHGTTCRCQPGFTGRWCKRHTHSQNAVDTKTGAAFVTPIPQPA